MDDKAMFAIALEEARTGFSAGGIPIGACLVSKDGQILGRGHNQRVQQGSVILHQTITLAHHASLHVPLTSTQKTRDLDAFHPLFFKPGTDTDHPQGRNGRPRSNHSLHQFPTPASVYRGATMYTTMLPCIMCTGACLLYGIGRVVYGTGAHQTAKPDTLKLLQENGVETMCMDVGECEELMVSWIEENPERYRMEPWAK